MITRRFSRSRRSRRVFKKVIDILNTILCKKNINFLNYSSTITISHLTV